MLRNPSSLGQNCCNEDSWDQLSKRTLRPLRRDIPQKNPSLMEDGWVKIATLQSRWIQINEEREYGLIVGKGVGRMTRFQIAKATGTGETIIRLIQQDKRRRGDKGRNYTPMNR